MALSSGQRAALQYINDNSPTRGELVAQETSPTLELLNIISLKLWAFALYDGVADQWTITASGITELAS